MPGPVSDLRHAIAASDPAAASAAIDSGALDYVVREPLPGKSALTMSQLSCAAVRDRLDEAILQGGGVTRDGVDRSIEVLKLVMSHSPACREVQVSTGRSALHTILARTALSHQDREALRDSTAKRLADDVAADCTLVVLGALVSHMAALRRKVRIDAQLGEAPVVADRRFLVPASGIDTIVLPSADGASSSPAMELFDDVAAATLAVLRHAADGASETPIATALRHGNVVGLDRLLSQAMPCLTQALRDQSAPHHVSSESVLSAPPGPEAAALPHSFCAALPLNAVHVAAACGNTDLVRYLLTPRPAVATPVDAANQSRQGAGADPAEASSVEQPSFAAAARGGWLSIHPDAHDATRVEGGGALHTAAAAGFASVVAILLDCGCDPMNRDRLGRTALHVAAEGPHVKAAHVNVGERSQQAVASHGTGTSSSALGDGPSNVEVMTLLLDWHEDHAGASGDDSVTDGADTTVASTSSSQQLSPTRQRISVARREKRRLHAKHMVTAVDRGGRSALDSALRVGRSANAKFLMRVSSTLESSALEERTKTVSGVVACQTHDDGLPPSASAAATSASDRPSAVSASRHGVDASVALRSSAFSEALTLTRASSTTSRAAPVTEREVAAAELAAALSTSASAAELWRSHRSHVMRASSNGSSGK